MKNSDFLELGLSFQKKKQLAIWGTVVLKH